MDDSRWDGQNPWLGLYTYHEGTKLYGRDNEISTLTDIVCNNLATVVFGRSGIGKSSLIHAGLSPEIRKRGMKPVYIRLEHNTEIPYINQIEAAVCGELETEDRLGRNVPKMGLWDFFHRNNFFDLDHNPVLPVIIIDQFEEIYTLADAGHKQQAQDLFEELADLLNNVKPGRVMTHEASYDDYTHSKIEMGSDDMLTLRVHSGRKLNYSDDNNFHLLVCLREDYLYYLERNTSKIPSFKVNRFSLQALHRASALDVILMPRPGLFSDQEADEIIDRIATIDDEGQEEIDPTILSIFLHNYYNSKGNVKTDNIISNFYDDATNSISDTALAYLENSLITGEGFRHIITYNDALANGVTKEEINKLLENRILTIETRKRHQYLEFSHDILCPIAKSHTEKRKIAEQTRRLRKRIITASASFILALVLIGSFLFLNHRVLQAQRSLNTEITRNNCSLAHYMIVKGDVLDAVDTLLKALPDVSAGILPESERVLNEAYDSLYSPFACTAILNHPEDVTTAEYSEDTELIITACADGYWRIWDGHTGQCIKAIDSGIKDMTGASLNSDASKVIASFRNGSAIIWDMATDTVSARLVGHNAAVNYACFSPDGTYALTASDDNTVRLWNANNGNYIKTIAEHAANVNCAIFSTSGEKVVTSSEDGTAMLYDFGKDETRVIFNQDDCSIDYAEFNYDDTKIAIVTNQAVYILDESFTIKCKRDIQDIHDDLITSASFSPDGESIATSSHDKTIKLWNVSTGNILHSFEGHSNIVKDVVFSPDGKYILSTSSDNEARIWNTGNTQEESVIHSGLKVIASATYSPGGKYIAAISATGKAIVWDSSSLDTICTFGIDDMANSIVFNQAEDKVVVASDGKYLSLFDIPTGKQINFEASGYDYAFFSDDDKHIIAYSRNGKAIQLALQDPTTKSVDIPELDSLTCFSITKGHAGSILYLASFMNNTEIRMWEKWKHDSIVCLTGHSKEVCCVRFSHDAKRAISGSSDNTAIIWNTETGTIIHKLKRHSSQVNFAEFSRDDYYALTTSPDGTIRIWNTSNGNEVAIRYASTSPRYTYMICPVSNSYIIVDGDDIHLRTLFYPEELIYHFNHLSQL